MTPAMILALIQALVPLMPAVTSLVQNLFTLHAKAVMGGTVTADEVTGLLVKIGVDHAAVVDSIAKLAAQGK